MKNLVTFVTFAACAIGIPVFAQPGHAGGGAGMSGPTSVGGNRSNAPGTFPGTDTNAIPDFNRSALFLSGKVAMEDGTPPPDLVTIQMVCTGSPHGIGYTDAKGRFSINVRDKLNNSVLDDASEQGSFGGVPGGLNSSGSGRMRGPGALNGCDLRANLAGFRSDSVNLFDRKSTDNPDVGTIFLHRRANVEGLTVSATTAMAPASARKAFDKGREEERKGKWADAQRQFQKAVDEYPKFAAAWFELGRTQEQAKDIEAARKSYQQSLVADAKFVSPYDRLAELASTERKWEEVLDDTTRLLRLNPVDFPRAWFLNAFANLQLQHLDAAEKSARDGLIADSAHRFPQLLYMLGAVLMQKQDYAGAAENMRAYIAQAPNAPDVDKVKQQLAEVEKQTEAKKE
jgi:hypothetical protein